jgi:hypothetical protein
MPTFVFNLNATIATNAIVDKLLTEALLPLFRKLHPEKRGWNLSLVNVAATNMADAASERGGIGRDIGRMFKRQDEVLKQWRVEEEPDRFEEEHLKIEEPKQTQAEQEELVLSDVSFERGDVMMDECDGSSREEGGIIKEPEVHNQKEEDNEYDDEYEWLEEDELAHREPRFLLMQLEKQLQGEYSDQGEPQILLMQSPSSTPSSEREEEEEEGEEEHLSQEPWLAEWKRELAEDNAVLQRHGSEDFPTASQDVEATVSDVWEAEDDDDMMDAEDSFRCEECGAVMPIFALGAHHRWHEHM